MGYDKRIIDIATTAAAAAAKNAQVAPQLLLADITFALVDAVEQGRIVLATPATEASGEVVQGDRASLWPGLDHVANFINALDSEGMTGNDVRSAIYTECLEPKVASERTECHGLDTPERVCFYEQDFYVLSNFSAFTLMWRGIRFDTLEAAYHWEKFYGNDTHDVAEEIRLAPSAHVAFQIAAQHKDARRFDWDDYKVGLMRRLIWEKAAQHEYVHRKLLATGNRELVENSWRDDFWGWGPNRDGQNMLGKLWMELRAELALSTTEPVELQTDREKGA